jgi:hypothetical protein
MNNISPHPPTLPHAGLRLRAATVNPHAPGHQQMLKSCPPNRLLYCAKPNACCHHPAAE